MKIIKKIEVERFRSIRASSLDGVGEFSVLAGLNNSGKSNFLRALNAFFNDTVEPGIPVDLSRDFYRPERKSKKRKSIRVTTEFDLPDSFRFRAGLGGSKELLGSQFAITKEWSTQQPEPLIYIHRDQKPLAREDAAKVHQFLSLINFRYVPNRVVPTELIANEYQSLRDVLIRRLARHKKSSDELFQAIEQVAKVIIGDVATSVGKMAPGVSDVRLGTAKSLADLALRFGYWIKEGDVETDESEQGSGMQSLLMFQTLHLIDRDYFQKFGWRQAAVWAVEEPESSLHTKLEAEVARFLAQAAKEDRGRLQILATTHSDLMIQYADAGYFIDKTPSPTPQSPANTVAGRIDKHELLSRTARFGISRWVNPLLFFPLDPLVIVEGPSDKEFILEGIRLLRLKHNFRIETLDDVAEKDGGIQQVIKFLKDNMSVIRSRSPEAPVILVGDWDAREIVSGFKRQFHDVVALKTIVWDEKRSNPNLDESFTGIERFFSDRMIAAVEKRFPSGIATAADGKKQVHPKKYERVKQELRQLVRVGLEDDDVIYAKDFISVLAALAKGDELSSMFD